MTHRNIEGDIVINNRGIESLTDSYVNEERSNNLEEIENIEISRTLNDETLDQEVKMNNDSKSSEKWRSNLRFIKRTIILESFHLIDKPISFVFMSLVCLVNTFLTTISLFLYVKTYKMQFTLNILFLIIIYFLSTILYVMLICLILSVITNRSIETYLNMSLTTTTHFPFIILWCLILPEFGFISILLFQTIVFLYIFSHFTRFSMRRNLQNVIFKILIVSIPVVSYYNGMFILLEHVMMPSTNFDINLFRILNLFTKSNN